MNVYGLPNEFSLILLHLTAQSATLIQQRVRYLDTDYQRLLINLTSHYFQSIQHNRSIIPRELECLVASIPRQLLAPRSLNVTIWRYLDIEHPVLFRLRGQQFSLLLYLYDRATLLFFLHRLGLLTVPSPNLHRFLHQYSIIVLSVPIVPDQ